MSEMIDIRNLPAVDGVIRKPNMPMNEVIVRFKEDVDAYMVFHAIQSAPGLAEKVYHPETDSFIKGVVLEAEYQRRLHGIDESAGRFNWHQWFWVLGYLGGKLLAACAAGDIDKAKHRAVTTAAILNNWHNVLSGKPAASVHTAANREFANKLSGN